MKLRSADTSFFEYPHGNFFRPLSGRNRDGAARCIRSLYLRINGPEADYQYHQNRSDVVECFTVALRDAVALDPEGVREEGVSVAMSRQDRASAMLRELRDCGWIEKYSDPGSMRNAYRFTPRGRQFAALFAQDADDIITSTQNTRSTLAHLRTFTEGAQQGRISIPDLMIAAKLSSDIVGDFNDIIEEVTERKRRFAETVTHTAEQARAAGLDFFEYMGNRFVPEIEVRFNEDSVERYRSEIKGYIERVWTLRDDTKRDIERKLRAYYPMLLREGREVLLAWVLNRIEKHIDRACDAKLPELRRETRTLVRRADALMRHLGAITFETEDMSVGQYVASLSRLPDEAVTRVLDDPRSSVLLMRVALIDPQTVAIRPRATRSPVGNRMAPSEAPTREAMLDRDLRQELARIFRVDIESISEFVVEQLAGGRSIRLSEMQISDVPSLLSALHAGQVAGSSARGRRFRIRPIDATVANEYFETRDYVIEVVEPRRGGPG